MRERVLDVNGRPCRVWEKGEGEPLGYLPGAIGLARWTPFLDRLAEGRRVIVPSLPGFHGSEGHDDLDDLADWVTATLDILDAAGLRGADLIGSSFGGALAAEAAAFSPGSVRRLVLMAPFGLHVPAHPVPNFWAMPPKEMAAALGVNQDEVRAQLACPQGIEEVEWTVITRRAVTAGARLFWPMGDVGLAKRLHRIECPVQVLWGAQDKIIDPAYAAIFASAIRNAQARMLEGAGHALDWDAPDEAAALVRAFLD